MQDGKSDAMQVVVVGAVIDNTNFGFIMRSKHDVVIVHCLRTPGQPAHLLPTVAIDQWVRVYGLSIGNVIWAEAVRILPEFV
jgi:hypothetical protein